MCHAQMVFKVNSGYDFKETQKETIVFSEFNQCSQCQHYYTANYFTGENILMQVFVPPNSVNHVQITKIIGPPPVDNYDSYMLDSVHLLAKKQIYKLDDVSNTNTSVILLITSKAPHAHYAVSVGKDPEFNILDYTIKFGANVQKLRWWNNTFVYFIFFLFLCVFYFLMWPLKRYKSYVILPKIAFISFLSWLCDAFYQYFFIVKYTSSFSMLSFIMHILPNSILCILLCFMYEKTINKEIWLISIASVSLLYGGGGFYIGSAACMLSWVGLSAMKKNSEGDKDKRSLFCKNAMKSVV